MKLKFRVCFEPEEDGGFHAFVPALPGCHTYGATLEEAEEQIKEAIALYIEGLIEHGLPIPKSVEEPILKEVEVEVPAGAARVGKTDPPSRS